jgi:DNA-binding ferritin-like protein
MTLTETITLKGITVTVSASALAQLHHFSPLDHLRQVDERMETIRVAIEKATEIAKSKKPEAKKTIATLAGMFEANALHNTTLLKGIENTIGRVQSETDKLAFNALRRYLLEHEARTRKAVNAAVNEAESY